MSRYPRAVRGSKLKCVSCNAPVVRTVDEGFVCVECGEAPIESRSGSSATEAD